MGRTTVKEQPNLMKTVTVVSCCDGRSQGGGKDYEAAAVRLARSIRVNGGHCKGCNIAFWMDADNQPTEETKRQLVNYDCKLYYGKAPIDGQQMSKKIAACCLDFDTDYTVWMDTDIYVLKDFSALLDMDTDVAVSPTTRSHHRWAREEDIPLLDNYYTYLGLKRPDIKVETHQDKKLGNFYFSSGLIVFKSKIDFGIKYLNVARSILSSDREKYHYSFDQVALPLLIVNYDLTYTLIEERYHYVYGVHNHRLEYEGIVIVHYQDRQVTEVPDNMWGVDSSA